MKKFSINLIIIVVAFLIVAFGVFLALHTVRTDKVSGVPLVEQQQNNISETLTFDKFVDLYDKVNSLYSQGALMSMKVSGGENILGTYSHQLIYSNGEIGEIENMGSSSIIYGDTFFTISTYLDGAYWFSSPTECGGSRGIVLTRDAGVISIAETLIDTEYSEIRGGFAEITDDNIDNLTITFYY